MNLDELCDLLTRTKTKEMASSNMATMTSIYMPFAQKAASELNVVCLDHCYAKPWNTHPEASNAHSARYLFMDPLPNPRLVDHDRARSENELIDVETADKPAMPEYDVANARGMMSECERHAALLHPDVAGVNEDWEDHHIPAIRTTWTAMQNRLFAKVMRVLHADRLARIAIQETKNEPIQRRLQIDKAAKRVKFSYANINWDMSLILWLHNIFLNNLRGQLLTSYLEILQTLRIKIPSLVQSLIEGTECKPGGMTTDSLNVLLKRTWDPILSSINLQKPKKLPGQPLLLVLSNMFTNSTAATKRHKFWHHQLNFLGKVVNVAPVNTGANITVGNFVENMVAATRSKIIEVRVHFPDRPIVLVGFHIGSLVISQVALVEQVEAVVCLGYPTMGVRGNRGEVDDPIYNCKVPTLYVVGQHASSCSVDDLEDIREKLRVDTGLIVIGGADDHLRMSRTKKKLYGVIQSVVDRCIIDEISHFVGTTLQAEISSSDSMDDVDMIKKFSRKRKKQTMAVAVGTSDFIKQKSAKALKSLKQDPMLSSVSLGMGSKLTSSVASGSSLTTKAKMNKTGKKSSPKRLFKSSDIDATPKRSPNRMKAGSSKKSQSSLSTRNEAAIIASAPELSNLLQSLKTDRNKFSSPQQSQPLPAAVGSSSTLLSNATNSSTPQSSSSSVQTSTALTLSKFLLSSNILKPGDNPSDPCTISLDSLFESNGTSKATETHSSSAAPTDNDLSSTKKQETQILIRTKDSAVPLSFPVTFTMANNLPKSNAQLVKQTGGNTPLYLNENSISSVSQSHSSKSPSKSVHNASPILSSTLQSAASSSHSTSPLPQNYAGMSTSRSPLASVISIGSDSVQMKETPPTTSTPGTVSIDLGQLSASNNIVMKFGGAPKVSMSGLKMSSSPSIATTCSATTKSNNATTLTGLSSSSVASKPMATTTTATISINNMLSNESKTIPTAAPLVSSGTAKAGEKNLTILSNSGLLSSLKSNSGLITLKLSTASKSTAITLTSQKPKKDSVAKSGEITLISKPQHSQSVSLISAASTTTFQKNVTSMTFNPSTLTTATLIAKPRFTQHIQKPLKQDFFTMAESKGKTPTSGTSVSQSLSKPLQTTSLSSSLNVQPAVSQGKIPSGISLSQSLSKPLQSTPLSQSLSKPLQTTSMSQSLSKPLQTTPLSSSLNVQPASTNTNSSSQTIQLSSSSDSLGKVTSIQEASPGKTAHFEIQTPKTSSSVDTASSSSSKIPIAVNPPPLSKTKTALVEMLSVAQSARITPPSIESEEGDSSQSSQGSSVADPVSSSFGSVKSVLISSISTAVSPANSNNSSSSIKPAKSTAAAISNTPTTKNALPTVATTRTRRIKTPKQYDL